MCAPRPCWTACWIGFWGRISTHFSHPLLFLTPDYGESQEMAESLKRAITRKLR
nr:MAG TPA: hypothetical protein [Caudoviricetes sp.]